MSNEIDTLTTELEVTEVERADSYSYSAPAVDVTLGDWSDRLGIRHLEIRMPQAEQPRVGDRFEVTVRPIPAETEQALERDAVVRELHQP